MLKLMLPCPATSADAERISVFAAQFIARLVPRRCDMTKTLTRRAFLQVSSVGGAFIIGGYIPGLRESAAVEAAATFAPNIWVKIGADDAVTIMLTQLEMGQGVMTSMPMLLAEELDADWNKIKTEWVPADPKYGNPNFGGAQLTAGSNSVRGMWKILREAGGTARVMLVSAAAQTWNVPESACTTEKGEVIHQASGRRLRYGALADKAATLPVPKTVSLKSPKEFRLLGQSTPRLDIPEKVNGSAVFGIDVKRPGMLIARVVKCPVFGGKVESFNADKAKAVPGVRGVVKISSGVAVVADNYWAASKGVQALEVKWNEGPLAGMSSADIRKKYVALAEQPGSVARNNGDAQAEIKNNSRSFERIYEVPFLAHACMEPMNCTADVRSDRCDVWVPTQGQTSAKGAAVAASGLPANSVNIYTTYLGGGFGRRGEADYVTDAVETSKAVGKPVKLIWTREDDIQHDYYRPVTYVRMWGATDASGKPTAFMQRIVQQSLMKRLGGLPKDGVDRISVDGSATLPYDIPNIRVEYIETDPGIPYGFWRSVGCSAQGFVVEAFMDELAAAAGKDPYEFRRDLLSKHPRHLAVLNAVAEKSGWGKPLPAGHARGIAVMEAFGSIVGQVAEVSVKNGAVKIHKVWVAVDTGWVINPDTIKAQMEGGTLYGLTAALKGEITIQNGRVMQHHFNDYQMIRHNEAPEVEVTIVASGETPGGIGEPSTAVAAGALANAISAATGKRIYKLPLHAQA
jgi:isoquinoline 1-oxidoreductase beta subunit